MAILIAPDKFRGTMESATVTRIIARLCGRESVRLPMADGGEGTMDFFASQAGWHVEPGSEFAVNELTREAVVESARVIGYGCFDPDMPPIERSSAALGRVINRVYDQYRPVRIYVGVGGTAACDGGRGMLETLWPGDLSRTLVGLVDVEVPLLPAYPGGPSALMFCPQKGFDAGAIDAVTSRLESVVRRYGPAISRFDGAGGGIGYALASVLGAECHLGAPFMLDHAKVDWDNIDMVVTGEGRLDRQTSHGKVVATMAAAARRHGIPAVAFVGCVADDCRPIEGLQVVDCSQYLPDKPLTRATAIERLGLAVTNFFKG